MAEVGGGGITVVSLGPRAHFFREQRLVTARVSSEVALALN